mmetsp:Transcript_2496/g.7762  ORF Transcript_2496/g.7762 Transcript_2496/m.7762 type:complete len:249 (+) Transcript_2496:495-1241(+)
MMRSTCGASDAAVRTFCIEHRRMTRNAILTMVSRSLYLSAICPADVPTATWALAASFSSFGRKSSSIGLIFVRLACVRKSGSQKTASTRSKHISGTAWSTKRFCAAGAGVPSRTSTFSSALLVHRRPSVDRFSRTCATSCDCGSRSMRLTPSIFPFCCDRTLTRRWIGGICARTKFRSWKSDRGTLISSMPSLWLACLEHAAYLRLRAAMSAASAMPGRLEMLAVRRSPTGSTPPGATLLQLSQRPSR